MGTVIVFEGANGVGKSTFIANLPSALGVKSYRAFRNAQEIKKKTGSDDYGMLSLFGVPVNTHVEDFLIADMVAAFDVGIALDRSLPSAIVCGTLPGAEEGVEMSMLRYWEETIKSGNKVLYVWLTAPYDVAKKRIAAHRWCPNKAVYDALQKGYMKMFARIKLPKIHLDTSQQTVSKGVKRICQALKQ